MSMSLVLFLNATRTCRGKMDIPGIGDLILIFSLNDLEYGMEIAKLAIRYSRNAIFIISI